VAVQRIVEIPKVLFLPFLLLQLLRALDFALPPSLDRCKSQLTMVDVALPFLVEFCGCLGVSVVTFCYCFRGL
jgi:hypothetical protein